MPTEAFKQWCIVELFGHRRYAGLVSEATFPPGFVRLDVPEDGARKATTHFYAPAAIYGLHPVDEATARRVAAGCHPEPVAAWEMPSHPRLPVPEDPDTAGDLAIALRKNGEIYPVSAISRGEVALLQYALQYAVARLAGVGVLIFDHAENIDEDRRGKFKGLVARCLKDGAQVLLLSCAKPTAKAPKGTACYTVVDGTVVEVEP